MPGRDGVMASSWPATPAAGTRRPLLNGTRQILAFNWPWYLGAALASAASAALAARLEPGALKWLLWTGVGLCSWWAIASIAASWWIYDASDLTSWEWLARSLVPPARWTNIHAGFDETTESLASLFPSSHIQVLDVYHPAVTPEPSLRRARHPAGRTKSNASSWHRLPLKSGSQDAVFFLFAAHEVRCHRKRVQLFREARRALGAQGTIVVVEHLRSAMNFIAFGPGFLHFLPRCDWTRAAQESGLRVKASWMLNPFVVAYLWEKLP